jgi:uncharacterized membrane protein YesL
MEIGRKSTMKIFSIDGPVNKYGTMVFDLIALNIIWGLLSVLTLGIGIGATNTALYYTVNRSMNEDKGSIMKDFFRSLKENFLKATVIWLILVVLFTGIIFNIVYIDYSTLPFGIAITMLSYAIGLQLLFVSIYIFPLLAKVELKSILEYFKVSFMLANKHPFSSLLCVIIIMFVVVITYYWSFFAIFAISVTALWISRIVIGKVIMKEVEQNEEGEIEAEV